MHHRSSVLVALFLCFTLVLTGCGGTTASVPTGTTQNQQNSSNPAGESARNNSAQSPTTAAAEAAPMTESQPARDDSTESTAPRPNEQPPESGDGAPPPDREETDDGPPYDSTYFQNYGTNPFVDADDDAQSTFAMDIDTASYSVMRRFLDDGYLPDPDSVRPEEYLNYFDYDYPQPDEGSNFAIYTEAAPSPFGGTGYEMVQIGIQGRRIDDEDRLPTSLTFVIDVSGSMDREDRFETVKEALTLLVDELRPDDRIGIVVYGTDAESILPSTDGADKRRILAAIDDLEPSGSTNVEAGLDIGFEQADEAFVRGSNMVMLLSDGVANNGVTDPA